MRHLPEPLIQAIESGTVPSPPQVLLRLMQLVDDESASIGELAQLVGGDAGLSARILAVANSPALGRGKRLSNLDSCLVALGTRLVRSIATCLSIQNLFEHNSGSWTPDLSRFWAHSLMVAELGRGLAAANDFPNPEEAYLAGLLHDIGELILLSVPDICYAELLREAPKENQQVLLEYQNIGAHHGEIGAWVADQWQLDSSFADGILFHHASSEEIVSATTFPQLIWVANALASSDTLSDEFVAVVMKIFPHCSQEKLIELRKHAEQRTQILAEALNLKLPVQLSGLWVWEGIKPQSSLVDGTDDPNSNLAAMIGGMALLEPLQQDLFALESDAEILLSLRESARILFDLNRVAFLFADQRNTTLSGKNVGGQPAIFRQVDIPLLEHRSLLATAVIQQKVCSTFEECFSQQISLTDQQLCRALSAKGILCIPITVRQQSIGVMVCGLSAWQFDRLARRLPWLLNFGRIAAVSLNALREAKTYRQQVEHEATTRFTRQARRVVHEAGNPLGIIKSYLKILDRKLPEDTGVKQELEVLTEEIDRVAEIVSRMSETPCDQSVGGVLDVGALIQELLLLYGDALFDAKGIKAEVLLSGDPLEVHCEKNSLKQILLNLWKNASEALVRGQQIKISLTDQVVHNGKAYIQVRMDDNGPGMSDAAMRSIYNYADKSNSGRRGIGLSIVGDLASRQGIPITCRSQAGKGTSIALLLPKIDARVVDVNVDSLLTSSSRKGVLGVEER